MSLLMFSQIFGGALFLAFAQTIFNTGLSTSLHKHAASISVAVIQEAGATGVRSAVPSDLLNGVLVAYNEAIMHVFYLAAGAAVAATGVCLGMGWKSIKKVKTVTETEEKGTAAAAAAAA